MEVFAWAQVVGEDPRDRRPVVLEDAAAPRAQHEGITLAVRVDSLADWRSSCRG